MLLDVADSASSNGSAVDDGGRVEQRCTCSDSDVRDVVDYGTGVVVKVQSSSNGGQELINNAETDEP